MSRDKEERGPECILCGKCLSACPLVEATGREELAPRSKVRLADFLQEQPGTLDEQDAARLASLCLGCGRCARVCAQGLEPARIVAGLRAAHPGWRQWLWKQWIDRASTLWPLARRSGGMLDRAPLRSLARRPEPGRLGLLLKSLQGLDRCPMRAYVSLREAPEPMEVLARSGVDAQAPDVAGGWPGPSIQSGADLAQGVLLFSGCAGQHLRPEWDAKARSLLVALGWRRTHAEFACCGSTLGTAGLLAEQHTARERNLEIWRAGGRGLVVAYCASCLNGLWAYVQEPELFVDGREAALWRERVVPLARLLKFGRFMVSDDAPEVAGYHRPCHVCGADHDAALLRTVLGSRLRELPDRCCGFGGPLRLADPALADAVARRRVADLAGLPQVLTGCTACALQLAASAPEQTTTGHWLDIFS